MLTEENVREIWDSKVKSTFDQYLKIKNVSPAYSPTWKEDGYMDEAINLFEEWAKQNAPDGSTVFIQNIEGKTPLLVIDIPSNSDASTDTVLLYGHIDKQPEMVGWREGMDPWSPTYIDDRLYARGSADDGYAMFSSIIAVNEIVNSGIIHQRMLIVIEASEESGSPDLPSHLEVLNEKLIKNKCEPMLDVSLVVCLDSGALTYDHLWITNSLRGLIEIKLTIKTLNQGTHSGGAGGIVPSTTNILRTLLDRISESPSGEIILKELHVEIPDHIEDAAVNVGEILKNVEAHGLPFANNVKPLDVKVSDQLIANTYKPSLEIIGIDGIPSTAKAGNVLLPEITVALSFRIPPGVDPEIAAGVIVDELNRETPYDANVSVQVVSMANGWEAPQRTKVFTESINQASLKHFGKPSQYMGEGGTIPFMYMLGEKYANAQFLVTGLLGPESNAHGPNEFLHLPTLYKLTACVSDILLHQMSDLNT